MTIVSARAAAAEKMYRALRLVPCWCTEAWVKGKREVLKRCMRCEAIAEQETVIAMEQAQPMSTEAPAGRA